MERVASGRAARPDASVIGGIYTARGGTAGQAPPGLDVVRRTGTGGVTALGYRASIKTVRGEGFSLPKRRNEEGTLSVLRTEDVPLQEVSGVCLRREAGGDMALVAFGDRTSMAAWVELPSDDAGEWVWKTVDLADVKGSLIPRDDPQVEAVCADGAGRILILQEWPPRLELLDWAARRVVSRISLEIPADHPLYDSWFNSEGSQGEGAAFMQNGHLLIAKEKDPAAFIEFGPPGEEPSGFDQDSALKAGAGWPIQEGAHVFVPLAVWMPTEELL